MGKTKAQLDAEILAFLKVTGIDNELVSEVSREMSTNPTRAHAMARDLGWTPQMKKPASHRGFADAQGNYDPALYEAAQRQARARADAKRLVKSQRKQERLRAAGKI